jgi:hypothetical protein
MQPGAQKQQFVLHEWCKIRLSDPSSSWHSKSVCTIITKKLCSQIILRLPFLDRNNIVLDIAAHTAAIDKESGFDLLNPVTAVPPAGPPLKLKQSFCKTMVMSPLRSKDSFFSMGLKIMI